MNPEIIEVPFRENGDGEDNKLQAKDYYWEEERCLDVTNCRTRVMPEGFENYKGLQNDIKKKEWDKLEDCEFKELKSLDLYETSFPLKHLKTLQKFSNLENLDLSMNRLKKIQDVAGYQELKKLYLVGNRLREIENLTDLPKLEMLELGDNKLRSVENLDKLTSLKQLWLGRNKIEDLGESLSTLTTLELLSLSTNRLVRTRGLSTLTNLRELYIAHNGISEISSSDFDTMVHLETLDLAGNKITNLKWVINEKGNPTLPALKELWMNDNKIEDIKEISRLKTYQALVCVYFERNPCAKDKKVYQTTVLKELKTITQLDALILRDRIQAIQKRSTFGFILLERRAIAADARLALLQK